MGNGDTPSFRRKDDSEDEFDQALPVSRAGRLKLETPSLKERLLARPHHGRFK